MFLFISEQLYWIYMYFLEFVIIFGSDISFNISMAAFKWLHLRGGGGGGGGGGHLPLSRLWKVSDMLYALRNFWKISFFPPSHFFCMHLI